MNNYNKVFYVFLSVFAFACNSKSDIRVFDFNTILKAKVELANKTTSPIKFGLCNEIPFRWDNIVILPPYSNITIVRKQNLNNSKEIEKMLPELTLDEGVCILLFIENNTIVRYSYVPRKIIDFNNVKHSNKVIDRFSNKVACGELYLKKDDISFSLFY